MSNKSEENLSLSFVTVYFDTVACWAVTEGHTYMKWLRLLWFSTNLVISLTLTNFIDLYSKFS